MADITFRIVHPCWRTISKNITNRNTFLNVTLRGGCRMRVNNVDIICHHLCATQCHAKTFCLPSWFRKDEIESIRGNPVSNHLSVDFSPTFLGIEKPLQGENTTTFGTHNPISPLIERPTGFFRFFVAS